MKARKRKGIVVPRVSKVNGREGDRFRSPENQWNDGLAIGRRYDIEVVGREDDMDVSGRTMDRPGLRAAIERIRSGEATDLIFARLDRYSRNTMEALKTMDEVHEMGGALVFGDLNVDTSTRSGRQVFTIMVSNAEREVGDKADELARNAHEATLRGVPIAPLKFGYRKAEDPSRRERGLDSRYVAVDDRYAHLIRPLFERRAARQPWSEIREWWKDETGEIIRYDVLARMVASRLYLGELSYGGVVSPVGHEPLVDRELFDAAQTKRVARPARSSNAPSLLAGILTCDGCGHPMTAGKGSRGQRLYVCQGKKSRNSSWDCPAPATVTGAKADEWVVAQVLAWADARNTPEAVTTGDRADDFVAADQRIADAKDALARAQRILLKSGTPEDEAADTLAELRADVREAEAVRAHLADTQVAEGIRVQVRQLWDDLEADGDVEGQRKLIRAAVASVRVQRLPDRYARLPMGDRASLTFAGDEDDGAGSEALAD